MKKGLKLISLIVGITAILVLGLGGTVSADIPHETDDQPYCAGYGWKGFQGKEVACYDTASDLFGLTTDECRELCQDGDSLAENAAEQGITVDELVEATIAERATAVQSRIDDGTVTQEQADLMIQQMAERTELAVAGSANCPVKWHMGGRNSESTCYDSSGMGPGHTGMMTKWSWGTVYT